MWTKSWPAGRSSINAARSYTNALEHRSGPSTALQHPRIGASVAWLRDFRRRVQNAL